MNCNSSTIKLLIKYYNYSQDNNNTNSTNDTNKTASNSNIAINQNYRYSSNSIISLDKNNVIKSKNLNKDNNKPNNIKDNFNNSNDNELNQDYLIHFQTDISYNNLENSHPPRIINIKSCIFLYLV